MRAYAGAYAYVCVHVTQMHCCWLTSSSRMYPTRASPLKMRYAHGRLDWARDAATSVHCCNASPTSRYVMHMADWIGRGMQPHRCTVVLHRPPQDTSCTWPTGLGEGCSHIGAHGRLDWARDAATSVHMADWIGRGMQPHRCTVVLHHPPQEAWNHSGRSRDDFAPTDMAPSQR